MTRGTGVGDLWSRGGEELVTLQCSRVPLTRANPRWDRVPWKGP